MTLRDAVGLVGFFLGILLHLFMFSAFLRRRPRSAFEVALLRLLGALVLWFTGNFLSLLLRQLDLARAGAILKLVDCATFTALAFLPPLLFHVHWIYFDTRHSPRDWEKKLGRLLLFLLYAPLVVLPWALYRVFSAPPGQPLKEVGDLQLPFLIVLGLAYYGSALVGLRILTSPRTRIEATVFRGLAIIFSLIPVYNLLVFWRTRAGLALPDDWLTLGVWLASLLPSSLILYYVYRYQFLDFDTSRPLVSALLILVTLAVYMTGVGLLGSYIQKEFAANPLLLQATLLAGILLLFPTLSRGLDSLVGRLFTGEIRRYREIGEVIHRSAPIVPQPALFKEFVEEHLKRELGTGQVSILLGEEAAPEGADVYPLIARDRRIGYLDIRHPQTGSGAEREAMRFLANEIAVGLDRCYSIAAQLELEREVAEKSHMEELGRVAASVAHNVKNPLSSMKTLLQLLNEADNLTKEQQEEIRMMIREVDRLSSTVTSLLKFSRLESRAESVPTEASPVDISRLVDSLARVFSGELQARGVSLEARAEDVTACADPEALTDIISNLLTNALEASPANGVVRLDCAETASGVSVSVEDQGPGVPDSIRERMFEPFVTTKSRGTGLGLAIVRRRVEQLGGRVTCAARQAGKGACFIVELPHGGR
jgi:signal transduction histidine kinase